MANEHFFRSMIVFTMLALFSTPVAAVEWTIKNLGVLPGAIFSTGKGINDLGQVTGEMNYGFIDFSRTPTQYVYISGPNGSPLQLIDTSGVIDGINFYRSAEINNSGQVVGTFLQGSSVDSAFTTNADGDGLQNAGGFSRGLDINDSGTSVWQGTFNDALVIAPDGSRIHMDPTNPYGNIRGINNAGQVAIERIPFPPSEEDIYTGTVWSTSDGFRPILVNGAATQLYDINNSGQVLSLATNAGENLVVIDPDNTIHTLNIDLDPASAFFGLDPYLGGGGFKLNDKGQVIGVIRDSQGATTFSFLTSIGTDEVINLSMEEDILAAGWSNLTVSDINNLGQITGTGVIDGRTRAFLITPVPEPETYAMMLAGLSLLGVMRRRKKT